MPLPLSARPVPTAAFCSRVHKIPCPPSSLAPCARTRRRQSWSCLAVASPEPAEPAAGGAAPADPKSLLERVADDPVLKGRAEKREAWTTPKVSLGDQILDILYVYGGLLDRPFGSGASMASCGTIVVARVRAEIQAALPKGAGPAEMSAPSEAMQGMVVTSGPLTAASAQEEQKKVQVCFEILRLMQMLSVDLEMMRAAVKEETLLARLDAAKEKCKSAMSLARML